MLTAMVAVDNICTGVTDKANIWEINTEQDYHEEKKNVDPAKVKAPSAPVDAQPSFINFAIGSKKSRLVLGVIIAILFAQFALFKLMYPYANFMTDSYSYIGAAYFNMDINIWPIGYSKFLRVFSTFFHSDTALVLFQYFFLELSILYFLGTLFYLLRPGKVIRIVLILIMVLNPLFLHMGNYVSSDAIFTGLSLIWIIQLIRMLTDPKPYQTWLQPLLLLLLFTIRYNALYYPLLAVIVYLLSSIPLSGKLKGISLTILLTGLFFLYNTSKYYALTKNKQFSAFAGWQMASNALFTYSHTANEERSDQVPGKFLALHSRVNKHMDSLKLLHNRPDTSLGIYYLWSKDAPLRQYLYALWPDDSSDIYPIYFKRWATVAPLFTSYGEYQISHHAGDFLKYYLIPNTLNYFTPPLEVLGEYNMGKDSIADIGKIWFDYKSVKLKNRFGNNEVHVLDYYPDLTFIINIAFLFSLFGFILLKTFKKSSPFFIRSLVLVAGIWVMNFGFSVLASPIVLRYQIFPMILFLTFTLLIVETLYNLEFRNTHVHLSPVQ
jgi:hypothetical protein